MGLDAVISCPVVVPHNAVLPQGDVMQSGSIIALAVTQIRASYPSLPLKEASCAGLIMTVQVLKHDQSY
jgi:hypothetical protein